MPDRLTLGTPVGQGLSWTNPLYCPTLDLSGRCCPHCYRRHRLHRPEGYRRMMVRLPVLVRHRFRCHRRCLYCLHFLHCVVVVVGMKVVVRAQPFVVFDPVRSHLI